MGLDRSKLNRTPPKRLNPMATTTPKVPCTWPRLPRLPYRKVSSPLSDIARVEGTYIVLHTLPYLQIPFPKDIPGG